MSSLSESDIIDFSVPELYQGGERIQYNWRKLKWSSSNEKILKIKKSGEVVPKKEGKAYIRVAYKGKKVKILAEVISPDIKMSNYKNNKQKHIITMTWKNNSSDDIIMDFSKLRVFDYDYNFNAWIMGEEEVLLHPGEKQIISFTYQTSGNRKISTATMRFGIRYKGYEIDVMGINVKGGADLYSLKDEL